VEEQHYLWILQMDGWMAGRNSILFNEKNVWRIYTYQPENIRTWSMK